MGIRYNDQPGDLLGPNQIKFIQKTHQKYGNKGDWFADFECPFCHNTFNCRMTDVRNGRTKSCGCLKKLTMSEVGKANVGTHHQPYKYNEGDFIGPQATLFLKRTHRNERGEDFGDFKCSFCGNSFNARIGYVASGHTSSCGCLNSKGEAKILSLLQKMSLNVETQKTFKNCFSVEGQYYKFDFYLPEYNLLIEYDGEQHFKAREKGYFTEDTLQIIQQRDAYKNQWCKNNNIPLIRISYIDFDKLDIKYLKEKINEIYPNFNNEY